VYYEPNPRKKGLHLFKLQSFVFSVDELAT
jgi:hypothetical protein